MNEGKNKLKYIKVYGANENNLKNINVTIPRDSFTVFTGLSGSGKSSLAFDTIFAEGQRRYMQSLSSYARQFLGQMEKPRVEKIEGMPPAISIDQKSTNKNPRSTVGTVTEIYDYFRLLYARVGIPHCPNCKKVIRKQTVDQIVDSIKKLEERSKILILSPIVRGRKGANQKLFERLQKNGFSRVIVDDIQYEIEENIELDKNKKHNVDVIVDRLIIKDGIDKRLTDSIEIALKLSEGLLKVKVLDGEIFNFSDSFSCPDCNISIDEIEPRSFSFNNPFGACPTCSGLGYKMEFSEDLMIPDKTLSFNEGCVVCPGWQSSSNKNSFTHALMEALSKEYNFSLDTPYEKLPLSIRDAFLNGFDREVLVKYKGKKSEGVYKTLFYGLIKDENRRYRETKSETVRASFEEFMTISFCKTCDGMRLKKSSLNVTIGDKNIVELTTMPIDSLQKYMNNLSLTEEKMLIGKEIIKEIKGRLKFLVDVGLSYLSLSRATSSLSGGEMQRIRLATQIGSGLVGVAYILDEPSIGLHQRDNDKLLNSLKGLRDLGNTLIVVEHDEDTIRSADYIVDIGPLAGEHGGKVVACGSIDDIISCKDSITGKYLSKELMISVPKERKTFSDSILIKGARENNLKNIDVSIPLGVMTVVTGVSGSGKSSLINEILYKTLSKKLNKAHIIPGKCDEILGIEKLDKIINIDQSPIGRTPRSNPATYTGMFDIIRDLFAMTPDAKSRGYSKGRFSFNVKGGRCEACSGDGIIKIEMHFLPDVYVTCDACKGKRYNRETLEVKYKGKSIYDVLNMTVEEALDFFKNVSSIERKLKTLYDVGLSYIRLGQSSTKLSGGEAQRIKLASELSKKSTKKTIYVLDEPTTGLHFEDVRKLSVILKKLSDNGNTVVVIEHNLDLIKTADYIIDLGPDGGNKGGEVVSTGTPEEIVKNKKSVTGKYLKRYL